MNQYTVDMNLVWVVLFVLLILCALFVVLRATSMKMSVENAVKSLTEERDRLLRAMTTTPPATTTATAAVPNGTAPPVLAAMHMTRDDFMKAIGTTFPQPVMLDNKLVHGGTGMPVKFYTDATTNHIYQGMPNA